MRRKIRTISSTPQRLWHEISWHIPIHSHFKACEPFETTDSVPNTHKISNDRPALVLSTQRTSMPCENRQFPGTICPSVNAFPSAAKGRCCVDICRGFSMELWKLPRKKRDLARLHTKWQWSVCFLMVHKKAPTKWRIRPGNGGFPCGIEWSPGASDQHWSAVADLMSFGTGCQWSKKGSHPGNESVLS